MRTLNKILRWFACDFGSTGSISHLLSFASMSLGSFYFDKILKYVTYLKIRHDAKLQAFCQLADDPQPRFVNGPHFEARIRPEITTSPNLTLMFKARFRPKSKMSRVSQDLRNCGISVA